MKHEITTTIDIAADPATVWATLTDLESWSRWNPFITSSAGEVAVDARLVNRMEPEGGRAMTFRPTVTEVKPQRVFEWLGHLAVPGLFDGRHRFELVPLDDGSTRLVHGERFSGLLVRPMRRSLDGGTVASFEAMNRALKTEAEARVGCSA